MPHKILLADDSITIQKVIGLTLSSEEFQLIVADNGDEAYEKAKMEHPELIIADTNMPGLNGYELCERIRKDPQLKEVPLILLVGTYETFDSERARKVGATDHITKPFESQQLTRKVRELLKKTPSTTQPIPKAPVPPPPPPLTEEAEPPTLEPLELEELEPEPVDLTLSAHSTSEAESLEETAPGLSHLKEQAQLSPTLEEAGAQPPSTPSGLDFSDLNVVLSDAAPPQPSPPLENNGGVSWNLEEFESYLAQEGAKAEAPPSGQPPEEAAVEIAFEETFVSPPAAEPSLPPSLEPTPLHPEPPPPHHEAGEEFPPLTVSEELAGFEVVHETVPEPGPPPPQPLTPPTPPPTPPSPPTPEKPFPPTKTPIPEISLHLEERIRELVAQRVSTVLEEILPRAIDEAITQGVERALRQVMEQWGKRSGEKR